MKSDAERLTDIIEAADKIAIRVAQGREKFDTNEDTHIVLMHLIQIIAEAVSGLSEKLTGHHPEVPWRDIVATRNHAVPGYFEIDLDVLWDSATIDVPRLAEDVHAIRAHRQPITDS